MAEILVRNLDKKTVDRLKKRASKKGRSLQSEVKQILEQAASIDMDSLRLLGIVICPLLVKVDSDMCFPYFNLKYVFW